MKRKKLIETELKLHQEQLDELNRIKVVIDEHLHVNPKNIAVLGLCKSLIKFTELSIKLLNNPAMTKEDLNEIPDERKYVDDHMDRLTVWYV